LSLPETVQVPGCALVFLALVSLGCGYAPVRGRAVEGLRVAPVKNATAQAEAGGIFATELRRELAGRGRLEPDGSSAKELQAELVTLRSVPSGVGTEGGAVSYRIDAELRIRAGEYSDAVAGGEDYLTGVDVLGTEANRRAALRRLARTLATEAIERYAVAERLAR
jgi:lipopolysaccharide assembly LptE-like protein